MVTAIRTSDATVKGDGGYTLISSLSSLDKMVKAFIQRPSEPVFMDSETTGLNPRSLKPILLQFKQGDRKPVIVDVRRWFDLQGFSYGFEYAVPVLSPLFNSSLLMVGANIRYDYSVLRYCFGIKMVRVFDVQIAEQVLLGLGRSDARGQGISFSLKAIAERRQLGTMSKEERNWFIDLDQREEWNSPIPEEQLEYSAQDVNVLKPIYEAQLEELKSRRLVSIAKLEMRVLPALGEVEHNGVPINATAWMQEIDKKEEEAKALEEQVLSVFGPAILKKRSEVYDTEFTKYAEWDIKRETTLAALKEDYGGKPGWGAFKTNEMQKFKEAYPNPGKPKPDNSVPNLNSTKQLLDAFSVLGIPVTSTGTEVLESLKDDYPEISLLMQYRKAIKFVQSFGLSLIEKIDPITGRIHPNYIQIGASTGRMSCISPNWQQLPSKGAGKQLRACVVAGEGYKLLTCDFSAQELLILANESKDENMLNAFRLKEDPHTATARLMFHLDPSVDTKKLEISPGVSARTAAKTINYGIVYGMGVNKLAKTLKIDTVEAKKLLEAWFSAYPGIVQYLKEKKESAIREMRSVCSDGRVRSFHLQSEPHNPHGSQEEWQKYQELLNEYKIAKSRIERQGSNSPIQGAGAGMTKLAVALFYEDTLKENSRELAQMIAVVHDECLVRCKEEDAEYWAEKLAWAMNHASRCYCPLVSTEVTVDCVHISDCWEKD